MHPWTNNPCINWHQIPAGVNYNLHLSMAGHQSAIFKCGKSETVRILHSINRTKYLLGNLVLGEKPPEH